MSDPDIQESSEALPESGDGPATQRVWPRRLAKIAAFTIVIVLALLAIVLVGLNTDTGRRFIVDQVEALEFENGMSIGIDEIDGSIYGEITIKGFTLSDPQGVFLSSPEVQMDWRPFSFINSHVDIRSLTAQKVVFERVPEFNEIPPSDDPLLPDYDIDIAKFAVDEFIVEPEVTGERYVATMTGKMAISDGRALANLDGTSKAGTQNGGGDRIALVLDAEPGNDKFDLKLDLNAPGDGLIAALAGLTEPLQIDLTGNGSWSTWNGQLDAVLAGEPLADLTLTARDGTFGLDGDMRLARFAPPSTASLLGESTKVSVTAEVEESAANVAGRLYSDAFNVSTNGLIELSDNTFNDFKVAMVLLQPSAIAPNLSGSGLRAILTLDGAVTAPLVAYDINAARVVMNDIGIQELRARGSTQFNTGSLAVPVSASIARITGLDTVAGGTLVNIGLNGDLVIEGTRFLSDNMQIQSDRIDANLTLLADTSTGLYTSAIDGRINNYRIANVGIFDIETDVNLDARQDGSYALAGIVRARSTSLANESVRDFLGGNLTASSDVAYGSDGVARFANLRLNAPELSVTDGRGTYLQNGRFDIVASSVSSQYGPIGLTLTGSLDNPRAQIKAANPGFGIGVAGVTADIRGENGNYRINATGDTDYGRFTSDIAVSASSGPLMLDIRSAEIAGIGVSGKLRQSTAGPFIGQLDASGQGLGGIVRLGATGAYQSALINIRARNSDLPGPVNVRVGSAILDARIVLYEQPEIVADVQIANTDYGAFNINAARAAIDYRDGQGRAQMLAEGDGGVPFRVSANADLQPDLWRASLQGRARGIAFNTTSPARIVPSNSNYELLPTQIKFGDGKIRLAGNYGDGLKLQSRLDAVNLRILEAFTPGLGVQGNATGSLDFAQATTTSFPTADARLTITDFSRTTAVSVSQPVNVNVVGQLQASGGAARAVIRSRGSVIGRINASLTPLPPGAGPWLPRLMQAPLSGGVRYNGPADTLFSLAGQPDQRLSGALGVAADFGGQVSKPILNGVVRADSLTYENQTYGTRLSDMALSGRFNGDRFEIEQLDATAGDGTVSATGYVSLASENGYPMDIQVKLDDARLAESDSIASTATGELAFTKQAGQTALLSGRIVLPETRYEVIRQGSAEIPELSGVRFKPPSGRPRVTGDEPATPTAGLFETVRLDIDLTAPERLFVSGMGLESEWNADVKISGTSAEPRMAGSVSLVRGTLGFAGRSFEITEGDVRFNGGRTLDPSITLVASERIEDVTVNVEVTGQAFDPQIDFTSTPGLPQDEIVSRILFGNSVGNLSVIQAVQLAASLNSLRGTGGGLNPLGELRAATGIDRLRILGPDETSGRGTSLAAGQYITDDIYIEVITDARGFTATQLEISLTPALSVLSQAGGLIGTSVNVEYQKDY